MQKVFLSYSFDDRKQAQAISMALWEVEIECWIAPGAIDAGQRWTAALTKAINGADGVVLLLTPSANVSPHVKREMDLATACGRRILPVVIGKFTIDDGIEYAIAGLQRLLLPARGIQANSNKVVEAVRNLLGFFGEMPKSGSVRKPFLRSKEVPKLNKPEGSTVFAIDYMRLHGAIEVPLLMELIGSEEGFTPWQDPSERNPSFYRVADAESSVISRDLFRFWKREWRYKKARPLLNPLWRDVSGNKDQGELLYWRALDGSRMDIVGYSSHPVIDDSREKWVRAARVQRLRLTWDELETSSFTKSTDVGFLFAIFECRVKGGVSDLELEVDHFDNLLCRAAKFRKPTPLVCRAEPLLARNLALKPPAIRKSRPQESFTLRIASVRKGESFIMLLGAYRTKPNGMPEYYVTDYFRPMEWRWRNPDGTQRRQPIRAPHGLTAARIKVPNGWFGQ